MVDQFSQDNRVNTTTAQHQHQSTIATFADGSYLVAFSSGPANWYDGGPEGAGQGDGIYLQRYDAQGRAVKADGVTLGFEEIHVNTYTPGRQQDARIQTFADGKFVVVWNSVDGQDGSLDGVYAQVFNANGTKLGSEFRVSETTSGSQFDPDVTSVTGGFVVSWTQGDGSSWGVYGQRFNGSGQATSWDGGTVLAAGSYAETRISTTTVGEQSWQSVNALSGGRTMYLYNSPDGSDLGVFAKIYNADGSVAVDEYRLNQFTSSTQRGASAVELSDGRIAVVWESYGQDVNSYGVFARLLSSTGTPLGNEFQVNTTGHHDESQPRIVALADGGFEVVWRGGDGNWYGVFAQRFDREGDKVGGEVQVNRTYTINGQGEADAAVTPNGVVVTWQSETGDGDGNGIYSRTLNPAEGIIAAVGGENVVSAQTRFAQLGAKVTTLYDASGKPNGHLAVWASESSQTTGDGSGWGLFAQRYDAQGRPVSPDGSTLGLSEFRVNSTTAGDQGYVSSYVNWSATQLDGGRVVIVWAHDDGNSYGVFGQIFEANGAAVGAEFRLNTTQPGEQWFPDVAALHGDNAGEFIATWRVYYNNGGSSYDVVAQRFDNNGAMLDQAGAPAPGGGEFRVTVTDAVVNTSDGSEHQGRVMSLADGGWLVVYQDDGQDGWSDGVYAVRYNKDGVVQAGTNPDGGATPGAFRISLQTDYAQYADVGAMAALKDGGFVVTFYSGNSDNYSWGVWAQIYNADGTLRGAQFRVNTAQHYEQQDPSVAVLNDGSFVVVWQSSQEDSESGWDIYAKRYAADGTVLNEEFLVSRFVGDGNQYNPSVAATADGFVVVWDQPDASYDGSGYGVFSQRFVVESLNAAPGDVSDAHRPNLTIVNVQGAEDTAISLNIAASLGAGALGTESVRVELQDLPVGTVLSDGVRSFTATLQQTGVNLAGWTLANLKLTPPQNWEADITLRVVAISTDSASGDTAFNVGTLTVDVLPRAETMDGDGVVERVNSTTAGEQVLQTGVYAARQAVATFADGSYVVVWNAPDGSGWGVFGQRYNAGGQPVGTEFQVNVTTLNDQVGPSVEALPNGRFVVTWSSFGQTVPNGSADPYYSYDDVYQRVFQANGTGGAETLVNTTTNAYQYNNGPHIQALADGGYLIAWSADGQDGSSYGVYAQRYNANGAMVTRNGDAPGADEFRLNTTTADEQSWPAIGALPGGGWVAVWLSHAQDGSSYGVYAQRFGENGVPIGSEVLVNTTTADQQIRPMVTAVTGGYVVTWQSAVGDGSSWGAYARVYNTDGTPRSAEILANSYTNSDQSAVSVASTADGGFVLAWHSSGQDSYGYGIVAQRFDAEGDKVGGEFLVNSGDEYGEQYYPSIAGTPGGFVAVWQSNANGQDGSGWGVFGERVLFNQEIAGLGGEVQVNSKTAHEQEAPAAAALSDGSYVVVWQSAPARGTGDISSFGVFAQRYAADGSRLGGEFTVNTTIEGDQSQPSVTALTGGGFVVAWHSSVGDGSGYAVYTQRYTNAGVKVGGETLVNTTTSGNQSWAEVSALTGGGYVVAWEDSNAEIRAQAYRADGTAIGGEIQVNRQQPLWTGADDQERAADVVGTADGGFVVVWHDWSNPADGSSWGVYGQKFTVDAGAGTVTPVAGVHHNGLPATVSGGITYNFRVNSLEAGAQYNPKLTALSDGWVVVWNSDTGDDSSSSVRAQIYNTDGTRRGGEFLVNANAYNYQDGPPEVTTLSDGTFLVAWRSGHVDGLPGSDVYARRFSANGTPLSEDILLNSYAAGEQHQPFVTALGGGFLAVWNSTGQDGSAGGIFAQRFAVDRVPTSGAIADRPNLAAADATGDEDTAIALSLSASLVDTDGSETLRIEISGVPAGARLSDGVNSFTGTTAETAVNVAGWNLANLTITPPTNADADFTLTVRAIATETAGGDFAWNVDTIRVAVNSVPEPQAPFGEEFQVHQGAVAHQADPKVTTFADGSFLTIWYSDRHPSGYAYDVLGRLYNADGTPKGNEFFIGYTPSYHSYEAEVTTLADGGFLVTWTSDHADYLNVVAQRFDAAGVALPHPDGTAENPTLWIVNTYRPSEQRHPEVTAVADGGWIIVWQSYDQEGDGGAGDNTWGVYAKRYAADGTVVNLTGADGVTGPEVRINTAIAGQQEFPAVTQLAGGGLVFTWRSPDADSWGQYARVYNAAGQPVGSEFRVNTQESSEQRDGVVTALDDGGFVIVFHSYNQDGSYWGVYGRVYEADGTARGGEFRVNSYAYDSQQEPRVDSLPDGGFVVVWTSQSQDGESWGVYGQRFDRNGDQVGTEFRVNTTVPGSQSSPDVAVQPDGSGFVVVWETEYGVFSKRVALPEEGVQPAIDRDGPEQRVNDTVTGDQMWPDVAKLADGSFVVVWQSWGQDGSNWGVYGARYAADGTLLSAPEVQVNLVTSDSQWNPTVIALPPEDGGFLVVWQQLDGSGWGVFARRFDEAFNEVKLKDASGAEVSVLQVNANVPGSQGEPSAALLQDGSVVVAWQDDSDGSSYGVYSHRIDATGQLAAGADVLVNTIIGDQQRGVELAALTTGGYVAVYKSHGHDGSGWGVYGQRFLANGDKDGGEFLVNTYTDSSQGEGDFDQHRDPDVAGLADGGFVVVWETYTGADTDASSYGIAGQRYNAAGQPVGTEFLINGIARDAQIQATVEATPDGGFVVGWASENADANSYAVAVRRFDANGNATEPYGNDVIANTYTLNNQSAPALAMLERGFVAVWHSNGQDGSGWSIQMQRFEGKGLEPPPYVVDAATGGNSSGDLIFSTIAEAVAAANGPDGTPSATIVIRGGTYTLPSTVTITADDLTIRNFEGETVVINGPAGAAAFVVGSGKNATFESELLGKLTINAGAGAPTAIDFAGLNGGSELSRVAVNAAGGNAVRFGGGQNGVVVEDSAFGGTSTQPLVLVLGAFSGAAASSGMIFEDNQFAPNGGSGLVSEATGDTIVENTFGGTIGAGFAALVLRAAGADVQDNIFSAAGAGARIYDIANAYSESALLANNAFPAGWVSVDGKNNLFGRVAEALTVVDPSGVVRLSGHDRAIEGVLTVVDDALTIDGGAAATGLDLLLGAGVAAISLAGASGTDVTGNALANTLNGSGGANALDGSSGGDTINGGSGADTLGGGDGDDVLAGDGDADLVAGGAGNDAVIYRVAEGADTISGGTGNDTLQVQATNFSSGDQLTLTGTASGFTAAFTGHGAGASVDGVEVVDVTLDGTDGVTLTGTMTGVTGVIVRGGNGNTVADASALVGAPVAFTGGDGLDTLTGGASLLDSVDYAAETGGAAVGVNLSGAAVTFGAVNLAAGRAIDSFGDLDTLSGIENVRTGAGADRIWGSNSANVFEAGAGADTLTGGGGIDSFVFQAGFGADRITDFDVQEEVLRFSSAVFANRAAALAAASAAGGNTTIAAGGGNTVTLSGATGLGAWNIDILGVNDGPTIRASTPAAAVEAGVAGAGTPSAVAQLRVRDVDGVAGYDAAALTAAGWTAGAGGVWTKGGTYGQAVLDTAASTLTYQLDNADADTQALRTGSVTETFAVPVIDNGGLTASTNVVFSITAANDAPVAVADAASAAEAGVNAGSNATGNVLTNDTDVDASDTKAVSAVAFGATSGTVGSALAGAYGSLTLNANGGFSYAVNNANASVQALRTAGQTLTETFSYTVVDAAGATSTSTLTVTITGANDAPVAVADTGTAREAGVAAGQAGSGNVLTNDTDVDVQGETKAVSAVAFGATAGTLGAALTGQYGALTLNANGTWSYVVNDANASVQALRTTGQTLTDTFSYTVRDAAGATSTANLTVTIQGANDAVIGVADAATAVEAGTAAGSNAVGNVLTNDTDVDAGDTKTVSAVAFGATAGVVGAALNGEYGALTVNADGTFSYAVDNADPAVQALRTAGQTLTETFTYTVRDTAGATSTASLTVTIQGANDAPVAVNNTGTAAEAGAVAAGANANGNVLNNDTDVDAGDTKRISGFSFGATNGVVGSALEGAYGTLTVNANGSWTYVVDQDDPAVQALRTSGQTLTETFRYVVRDAANASDQGVLTITITGANDAPVAVADAGTAVEAGVGPGSNATGDVLANDTDPDVQGETRTVTGFSFGAATAAAGATLAGEYGSLRINANGSYSYVVDNADPAVHALANSGQTLTDTFSYTMRDAAGATSTATLVITVVGQNDAPAAQPDGFTITRDVELTLPGALFTGNDSDVEGGTLSVTAVSNVTGGTAAVVGGAVVVTATGGPLSFTYTVSDGSGGTSTATATLLTVASTSGADSILGVATADMLHGQAGGDTLDGGAGADTLIGGLGDDVFLTDGLDQIVEAANGGFDEVRSALSHTLAQNVEALRLTGAAAVTGVGNGGANQLTGNGAANSLQGLGGADTLDGGGGADTLTGGTGDDVYIVDAATTVQEAAGEGAADEVRTALAAYTLAANVERLTGTSAAGQALTGNGLANSIAGGVGADTLAGGEGPDTLAGGLGDDIYLVEAGDVVSEAAGQGVDEVRTALASYTLTADVEHLTGQSGSGQALTGNGLGNAVRGGSGADTLSGGTGDDTVTGGAGNDSLSGGSGTDTVSYAGAAAVTVSLASTTAQATGGAGLDTLAGFENLIGSNGGDMLTGDERANGLYGWLGNDTLLGGAGADTLDGGEGVDTASWAGALVRVVADLSTGLANSPGGEVDQLILIERLVGSAFNDVLKGDGGANSLAGGDGADTLEGGLGNDSLDGGAGVDTVTYAGSAVGVVVNVTGNNQNTQGAGVDNLAGVENLVGSDFADTLRGDGGANSLVGGAGSDTLAGGLGDDTLAGGTGADTASYFGLAGGVVVDLGAAAPQATGAAGADTLLGIENVTGGNGGDVLSGDDGVNDLRGQGGEDRLVGRGGRDLLGGGDGADTIVGGLGKDRLTGGTGADTFVFETLADSGAAKAARDVIRDFSGTDGDRIDLSGLDAVSGGADDAFRLVAAFSGAAGELVVVQSRRATLIQGDVDGDGRADFSISLDGAHTLTADHFLL